jgi:hypothetical protein
MEYKKNMNIGLAGEYMVAGMLNIQGWYASLTLKNYPDIDIIANKVGEANSFKEIQVKSTKGKSSILVGNLKKGATEEDVKDRIVKGDYIFVWFDKNIENNPTIRPDFYIVPYIDMIKLVKKTNDNYFNKTHEKEIKEVQPVAIKVADLVPYKERWDLLENN